MLLDSFFLANNLKIGWLKVQYYCERFLSYLGIEQTIGYMCDSTDIISRERQARFTLHFSYLKDARNIEGMFLQ